MTLFGDVTLSGGGTLSEARLNDDTTLTLRGDASEDVDFDGSDNALLVLDNPNHFTGTVRSFFVSDAIGLPTIDFGGSTDFVFHEGSDILEVTDGNHTAEIHFEDGYTDSDFSLDEADGHMVVLTDAVAHEPFMELG